MLQNQYCKDTGRGRQEAIEIVRVREWEQRQEQGAASQVDITVLAIFYNVNVSHASHCCCHISLVKASHMSSHTRGKGVNQSVNTRRQGLWGSS